MRTDRWNKKRELNLYAFYDHTGLERHLEKMAANGWMLESVGTYALRYRRCEPKKLRFAVVYYPKTDSFCPDEPNHENLTFWDYCAGAGWQIVTQRDETVVLLSKGEIDSKKVRVEFSLEDMDMSGFQKGATYEQIKAYVLEHTGLKVSSLYISQIKRKCGLDVGQNYNLSKKEDAKVPKCPPEKEAAIRDALKYFQMI